jgi:hypothetical protein
MIIAKTTPELEKESALPDPKLMEEMGKFNEELIKAGIVLAMDGLHPSSKGARVKFSGKSCTVIDGPFTEAKELVAGFWIWRVNSLEEAEIEIRQIGEMEDFAPVLSEEEIQHKIRGRAQLPNQTADK